jgi:hypothetical protein
MRINHLCILSDSNSVGFSKNCLEIINFIMHSFHLGENFYFLVNTFDNDVVGGIYKCLQKPLETENKNCVAPIPSHSGVSFTLESLPRLFWLIEQMHECLVLTDVSVPLYDNHHNLITVEQLYENGRRCIRFENLASTSPEKRIDLEVDHFLKLYDVIPKIRRLIERMASKNFFTYIYIY